MISRPKDLSAQMQNALWSSNSLPTDMNFDNREDSMEHEGGIRKAKTIRRHGACNPCKAAKTKCDGAEPCGACRSEKRKSRTCEYSDKAKGIAAAREEGVKRRKRDGPDTVGTDEPENGQISNGCQSISSALTLGPTALMHRRISLFGVVDEFMEVKSSKGRVLRSLKRIQTLWMELQRFIKGEGFLDRSSILPGDDHSITPRNTGGKEAQSMVDLWKAQLSKIEHQINNGDLERAWNTIPYLVRKIETWELFAKDKTHPPTEEVLEHIDSICAQLFDIDCILSFYLGGASSLPLEVESRFLSLRSDQTKMQNDHISSRLELISNMQRMLRINMCHEGGVWEFLHFFHDIKTRDPATTLEKLATCITNKAPPEKLALKMAANLVFVTMYCRTASVCAHYSRQECVMPPLNSGISDIVQEMKLHLPRQKGNECSQVIKHAGSALEAFDVLCDIDAENTSKFWFRPYGALIAAVLIGVAGLRDKNADWNSIRTRLNKVEAQLRGLKNYNPASPVFDKAIGILKELKPDISPRAKSMKITTTNTRRRSGSILSDNESVENRPMLKKTPIQKHSVIRSRKRSLDTMIDSTRSVRAKRRKLIEPKFHKLSSAESSINMSKNTRSGYPTQNNDVQFTQQAFHCGQPPGLIMHAPFASCPNISLSESLPSQEIIQSSDTSYPTQPCDDLSQVQDKRLPMVLSYPRFHVPLSYSVIEDDIVPQVNSNTSSQHMSVVPNNPHQLAYQQILQTSEMQQNSNIASSGVSQIEPVAISNEPSYGPTGDEGRNSRYYSLTAQSFGSGQDSSDGNPENIIDSTVASSSTHESSPTTESNQHSNLLPTTALRIQTNTEPHELGSATHVASFRNAPQPLLLRRASEPAWLQPEQYSISPQGYPYNTNEEHRNEIIRFQHQLQMLGGSEHEMLSQNYHYHQYHDHQPLYQSISTSF